MLNPTRYQMNTNQNHNEVSSHADQNGCHQKSTDKKNVGKSVEKVEVSYTVDGNPK